MLRIIEYQSGGMPRGDFEVMREETAELRSGGHPLKHHYEVEADIKIMDKLVRVKAAK